MKLWSFVTFDSHALSPGLIRIIPVSSGARIARPLVFVRQSGLAHCLELSSLSPNTHLRQLRGNAASWPRAGLAGSVRCFHERHRIETDPTTQKPSQVKANAKSKARQRAAAATPMIVMQVTSTIKSRGRPQEVRLCCPLVIDVPVPNT